MWIRQIRKSVIDRAAILQVPKDSYVVIRITAGIAASPRAEQNNAGDLSRQRAFRVTTKCA
jgi:hypothetical protein